VSALGVEIEVEQQAHDAEHGQGADGHARHKRPAGEDGEIDQRRLDPRLHHEQQAQRGRRDGERDHDGKGRRPRMRYPVQGEDEGDHERRERGKAGPICRPALP
jgi:hypothetical protein